MSITQVEVDEMTGWVNEKIAAAEADIQEHVELVSKQQANVETLARMSDTIQELAVTEDIGGTGGTGGTGGGGGEMDQPPAAMMYNRQRARQRS